MFDTSSFLNTLNNMRQSNMLAPQQVQAANLANQYNALNNEITAASAARAPDLVQSQLNYQNALSNQAGASAGLMGAQTGAANMNTNIAYANLQKLKLMMQNAGMNADFLNNIPVPASMGANSLSANNPMNLPPGQNAPNASLPMSASQQARLASLSSNQPLTITNPGMQQNIANNLGGPVRLQPDNSLSSTPQPMPVTSSGVPPTATNGLPADAANGPLPGLGGPISDMMTPPVQAPAPVGQPDPLLQQFQSQRAQATNFLNKAVVAATLGNSDQAKVYMDAYDKTYAGTPQMQEQMKIDQARLQKATELSDQSTAIQQPLNEFRSLLNTMSPSDFNALMTHSGVSATLNSKYQRLQALSSRIMNVGMGLQGVPAAALRSNIELQNMQKAFVDPHQLYDTLQGDAASIDNLAQMNHQNVTSMRNYFAQNGTTHQFDPKVLQQVDNYQPQVAQQSRQGSSGNSLSGSGATAVVKVIRSDGQAGTVPADQLNAFLALKDKDGKPKYMRAQ